MTHIEQFFTALQQGDEAQVKTLLAEEPALAGTQTASGASAVLYAVYVGRAGLANALLEAGAPLTIFEAAALGRLEAARDMLVKTPGLAKAVSPDGFSPLGLAAFFGHAALVALLLETGADPDAVSQNAMQVAPLHSAVANGDPQAAVAITSLLLQHGAQVNVAQRHGWTPLHGAVDNRNLEAARLLLAHGALVDIPNDDGLTPRQMAEQSGDPQLIALVVK
jgi:ankyrin repeat protein